MRPLTGLGAWLCASGSQKCMGARPTLVPRPIMKNMAANFMNTGFRLTALATRDGHSREASPGITPEDAAYSIAIPKSASVMPTEQSMMYFHAASVACWSL